MLDDEFVPNAARRADEAVERAAFRFADDYGLRAERR